MAESTSAVVETAPVPTSADLARAKKFTREEFVYGDERPEEALAPHTPRRRALDAALAELAAGAEHPSIEWRRRHSLLPGLERPVAQDEAALARRPDPPPP